MARPRSIWPKRIGIASLALIVAGAGLAFLGILPPMAGLATFLAGGVLGHVAVFGAAIALRFGHSRNITWALVTGGVAALAVLVPSVTGLGHPAINDVTTDIRVPPAFVSLARSDAERAGDAGYPERFKGIVRTAYADLEARVLPGEAGATFDRALALAEARFDVVRVDRHAGVVEATDTSAIFRFVDDVVIRVKPDPKGRGAVVDLRSRSRLGTSDMGVNAERIRAFLAAL